jgi:predicted nucleic acid-binding protein
MYENFRIAALDIDLLKVAANIGGNLEMHDKLIVATALYFDAPLITRDGKITQSEIVSTVW